MTIPRVLVPQHASQIPKPLIIENRAYAAGEKPVSSRRQAQLEILCRSRAQQQVRYKGNHGEQ